MPFVELLLILPKTPRVVTLEREAGTGAARGNLKLVDDLFPELVSGDALESTTQNGGLEQFAQV